MTDRVPDEIMREAVRTLAAARAHTAFLNSQEQDAIAKHIARALLRERQRAAEIAIAHGENSLDGQYWAGVNQAAVSISNAILSYDEAQK